MCCHKITYLMTVLIFCVGKLNATVFSIDSEHSNVSFSIRYLVSDTAGNFNVFSGEIVFEEQDPQNIQIQANIETNSIDTDNTKRDKHLMSEDFFDVKKYPQIKFSSTKTKLSQVASSSAGLEGDLLLVEGDFSMHGVTKKITLPVRFLGKGTHPYKKKDVVGFSAETTIKRSDFGINNWTDKAGVLSDEVEVRLTIQAVQVSD